MMLWLSCISAALALQPATEPESSEDAPTSHDVATNETTAESTESAPPQAGEAVTTATAGSDPLFLWSVRLGLSSMSLRSTQSTEDSTGLYPSEASYPAVRGVGFAASGELWWQHKLALEGAVRNASYRLNIGSDIERDGLGAWHLGLRYRHPLLRLLSLDTLLGVQRTNVGVLQYVDSQSSATLVGQSLTGARVGVGAFVELGPLDIGTVVAETFGIAPVMTEWDLKLELALTLIEVIDHHPSVYLGWTSAWRHWRRDLDGVTIKGRDAQGLFRAGAGFVF